MKKLFLFAAAAAMFTACSETEVLDQAANELAVENQGGVKFDVYTQRSVTRGGGQVGDLTNKTIVGDATTGKKNGFGVFAYYTAGEKYSTSATPNFMYNQQVYTFADEAKYNSIWKYEPVKYWPNEYGDAAISDEVDYVTFFSYAPWTEVEPTTGEIVPQPKPTSFTGTDAEWLDHEQHYNIISVNKNTATGDPIVKYVVDTDPATSVDLLWGVVAQNAPANYTPIDGAEGSKQKNAGVELKPGFPFIDLVKPNDPTNDKLVFNLKHALAKVRVTIDYIADFKTPNEGTYPVGTPVADKYDTDYADNAGKTDTINADETRIWLRQFNISGWASEGALNLNNTEAGEGLPLWKDIEGVKDIVFDEYKYQDGLKDGAEGQGKIDKGEVLKGLNPCLIEDAELNTPETEGAYKGKIVKFGRKNFGIGAMTLDTDGSLKVYKEVQEGKASVQKKAGEGTLDAKGAYGTTLLFGGDPDENGGYFYVIPRNQGEGVDVKLFYDVETIDPNLANLLSDNVTKGISTENIIEKQSIFGEGVDFEPGKQYDIHIHVGMTSVKIEATVQPWVEIGTPVVNLPDNQNPNTDADGAFVPEEGKTYFFRSYFDKEAMSVDFGKVETTGNFLGSLVEVEITESNADYAGKFYVPATAKPDGTTFVELMKNVGTEEVPEITNSGIFVLISEEDYPGEINDGDAAAAKALAGPFGPTGADGSGPQYTIQGNFTYDNNTNTFTYTAKTEGTAEEIAQALQDDVARMLGSLHRNGGVNEITIGSDKYLWDDAVGLKGSNFYKEGTTASTAVTDGNTLLQLIGGQYPGTKTFSVKTDKGDFTLVLP